MHEIHINTSMLGNFIYHGTYETLEGECLSCVKPSERDNAENEIAAIYLDIFKSVLSYAMPSDISDDFNVSYDGMYHPRFYNFETDSIEFAFRYEDSVKSYFAKYAEDNMENFNGWLYDNFTSRDGFISFTPNNYVQWLDGFIGDNAKCVSALLTYFLNTECDEYNERLWFIEKVDECICDSFIPYEYAVRFNNGYVGYCVSNYDGNDDCNRMDVYLFDENCNLVKYKYIYDDYNEYNNSAYVAWDEVERDITDNYRLTSYGGHEMDIDKFHSVYNYMLY